MIKYLFFFVLLTSAFAGSFAQSGSGSLDSFYTALAANNQLNANVLIAEKGRIVYKRSFGYANFEQQYLNTDTTAFHLASLSKVFTAVAVLQLAEKRKLQLDDPFAKFFPLFPYPDITIRQLMAHSSGLSDQDLARTIDSFERGKGSPHTNQELVPLLAAAKVKLKLSPNSKWWYCNLGYELLAALVEKASRQPFDQYLASHLFKPAGMQHTRLKPLEKRDHERNKASNYDYAFRFSPERIRVDTNASDYKEVAWGHSNVISTTEDLFRFDQALYNGKLLLPGTLKEAFAPALLQNGEPNAVWLNIGGMGQSYDGLGWFTFKDTSAGKIVWHAGGMRGCATIMLRNISRRRTVIIVDNTGSEGLYKNALWAMDLLDGRPAMAAKRSLAKIYGRALMKNGVDAAFICLQERKTDTVHYNLTENDMNNLGYELLAQGHTAQALETFKLNTLLYPASDNVYNSYAEALLNSRQQEAAIRMYQKSLELNPRNEDSRQALEKLITK